MSPERFAAVEQAFHRLSELAEPERQQAFDQLYQEDRELADEVARLLEASDATWKLGRFGRGEEAMPVAESTSPVDAPLPKRIGGFRISRELGRGGMGVVYLGERDDDFHQRAAIKVVKRGMDTDEILGRMRHERRILASLEHPNIARLIDGGTTDDGRPYFAMEFIEGRDLLEWATLHRLSLERRIRLFLEICSAVEYAHRNLVIHRDLKPSNILVTETGTAKLLDFGIAKLLASEGELRTTTGELLLTPDYASPEQVLGEPLTTASDVYSLGVVLYELLTGVHPYREQVKGLAGLYQFASNATVPRASIRVLESKSEHGTSRVDPSLRPAQLARALAGDLDNILGMALRREPERRYQTVAEIAEDLRRHLDFRPVRAHPESFGYRVGRFVRRQRLAVAASGLILLSLSGGIAGTSWQAHQADLARQQAEEQAELAQTVNQYLVDIFGEGDPGKHLGDEPTARDLLRQGREQLDELESQPQVLAALAVVIGEVYQKLGDHKEARELYGRSLGIRRARLSPPHAELVESLHLLADAERELGEHKLSEGHLLEALGQQKRLPEDPETLSILLNDLGATRHLMGDHETAERWLLEALELRRQHLGEQHLDTAQTLNNLAVTYLGQLRTDEATELMREALDITEARLSPEHPETMLQRSNLAATLHYMERGDEAVEQYEALIESQRRVFGDDHHEIGQSLNNLGWCLLGSDRAREAIDALEEALAILERSLGEEHAYSLFATVALARSFAAAGETEEALAIWQRLEQTAHRVFDSHPQVLISVYDDRGRKMLELGRKGDAARDLCRGLELRRNEEKISGPHEETQRLVSDLLAEDPTLVPEDCRRDLGT